MSDSDLFISRFSDVFCRCEVVHKSTDRVVGWFDQIALREKSEAQAKDFAFVLNSHAVLNEANMRYFGEKLDQMLADLAAARGYKLVKENAK